MGSAFLTFAGVAPSSLRVYPIETHFAEKLRAYTLPRPRPNSRVKDLPDIALLASAGRLDASAIRQAIEKTFMHRGTHPVPESLPLPPVAWVPVYDRMAKMDELRWRTLEHLHAAVAMFLNPVLAESPGQWDPEQWGWG